MPKSVSYKTNSIVYFKGDINEKIYILNNGRVSLNYNDIETGQEMHELIKTGEFFGVKSAMGKYPREETAVVLQDSTMIAFSVAEFEQIVLQNTRIMIKMLKVFSNQLRRIHKQVRNLLRSGNDVSNPETGLFNIGEYYLKVQKNKQAVYALRRYLTYYPSGKYASEAARLLESAEGGNTGNINYQSKGSSRQSPNDLSDVAKSYYNAVSLFSQEKFKESLTGFQNIVDDGVDGEYEAKARYEIGRCHFNLQRYELCIKHFTSLLQKYPKHPDLIDALFYVGKSYEEMGSIEKAAGFFKKVISMAKEEAPIMRKAKKALKGLGGQIIMALDLSMFNRFAVNFQPDDIIFCEHEPGDNFYLIQSGRVQIVKIIDDLEKIIDILQPGEIFGEMAILEEAPRSASAVALDNVKALEFNRENFEILMKGTPQIALKLLKLFTKRIYDQKRRFLILTLDDPQAKIADVFLMLSETQPITDETINARTFMTTVEDIAHWAGISPNESKRILNQFASQRRLEIFPDKIIVQNINDFARFVSSKRRSQVSE